MFVLNKICGVIVNPLCLGFAGCLLGLALAFCRRQKAARWLLLSSVAWLWVWSLPITSRLVGGSLERPYLIQGRVPTMESYPKADAIVLHGGSMGWSEELESSEMWTSADRVWMASRLFKAGLAPVIFVTGGGVKASTAGLLSDYGVPTNALVFAEEPRNTEEEARYVAKALGSARPKVLVVTSAWHMRRTMTMYGKYAPEIGAIPSPCDFENSMRCAQSVGIADFFPDPWALAMNCVAVHEWVGILGYLLFR